MATSVIVPGFTNNDFVPGTAINVTYGAGKRSAGTAAVRCRCVGAMREAQSASNTAVVNTGGGPSVTVSGTASVAGRFVIEITTAGALGTAVFRWSKDGGLTWTTNVTTAASVLLTGTGVTATFPSGTYVLSATYKFQTYLAATYGTAELGKLYDVFDEDMADKLFGAGSELALMCRAALAIPGVAVQAIAVPWAGSAAKASLAIVIGGTLGDGTIGFRLNKRTYRCPTASTDTFPLIAQRLAQQINNDPSSPADADFDSSGTVYLTAKTAGARGNYWSGWKDLSAAPAGMTMTLTGGTAYTGGGVPFSGGTGADDVTSTLAVMLPIATPLHDVVAYAQNDAVNMALIEAQIDAKAGPLVKQYEQAVFAFNGPYATAISLAQTTLNHVHSQFLFDEEGETHPAIVAAQFAAIRSVLEGGNPNRNYNGTPLPSVAIRSREARAKAPNRGKLIALLNAGVTPIVTVDDKAVVVRAITTKCLTGASADYRTLDVGKAVTPIRMSREVDVLWTDYAKQNPYAGPNPDVANGEETELSGVATPANWKAQVFTLLREKEKALWITDVANPDNAPFVEWDTEAKRIMSAIPVAVRDLNNQLGADIRQVA